jgi:hypothetical protein
MLSFRAHHVQRYASVCLSVCRSASLTVKVKVTITVEEATKAQSWSRAIALHFH